MATPKVHFPAKEDFSPMGCSDTARPESHTNDQLSRIYDALHVLEKVHGEEAVLSVWRSLPTRVQMDMNYAKWEYRLPSKASLRMHG